jgi:hypothetical protein
MFQCSNCPRTASQHKAVHSIYSLVRLHPDHYPALRIVEIAYYDGPVSFSTRAGRDSVRLGAIMVPMARVLALSLVDEAGLPWLEEYDIE